MYLFVVSGKYCLDGDCKNNVDVDCKNVEVMKPRPKQASLKQEKVDILNCILLLFEFNIEASTYQP